MSEEQDFRFDMDILFREIEDYAREKSLSPNQIKEIWRYGVGNCYHYTTPLEEIPLRPAGTAIDPARDVSNSPSGRQETASNDRTWQAHGVTIGGNSYRFNNGEWIRVEVDDLEEEERENE